MTHDSFFERSPIRKTLQVTSYNINIVTMSQEISNPGGQSDSKSRPLSWLITPSKNINYDVILFGYTIGTMLFFIFYLIELFFEQRRMNDDITAYEDDIESVESDDILKELETSLEGIYLIFCPFPFGLIWSIFMRQKWLQRKKGKDQESSKEKDD